MVAIGLEQGDAAEGFDEGLAFDFDAFAHFGGYDLFVVWVGAVDAFGDESDASDFEADIRIADEQAHVAFVTDEAREFGHAFEGHDELALVAFRELEIDIGHGESASIGSDDGEAVFAEGEEEAVQHVAGVI